MPATGWKGEHVALSPGPSREKAVKKATADKFCQPAPFLVTLQMLRRRRKTERLSCESFHLLQVRSDFERVALGQWC
jgi:hypothetical protein